LVAEEVQKLGLEVKGRQLGWVTAEGSLRDAYRMLLKTQVGYIWGGKAWRTLLKKNFKYIGPRHEN